MQSLEDALARYATGILASQPLPPRRVDFRATAWVFLSRGETGVFAIIGLISWAGLGTSLARGNFGTGTAILAAMAVIFIFGPLNRARRMAGLLRNGKRFAATVDSVAYLPKGTNRTFASMENGMSLGTFHTEDLKSVPFEFDQPWALNVREGTKIDLIIWGDDPLDRFVFGFAGDSPPVTDPHAADSFKITFSDQMAAGAWQLIAFFASFTLYKVIVFLVLSGESPLQRAAVIATGTVCAGAVLWGIAPRHRPTHRRLVSMWLLYTGLLLLVGTYQISQNHSEVSRGSIVLMSLVGAGALTAGFSTRPVVSEETPD